MKSFFKDIRSQSRLTREIMYFLCVIISISMVGMIWFNSLNKRLFVSLNPDPIKQEEFFAKQDRDQGTIFANVASAFGGLRAMISTVFDTFDDPGMDVGANKDLTGDPSELPISKDK